jgi:secondary thiamine-phosphate synthase enzyme
MKHVTETFGITTRQRCEMIDITRRVEDILRTSGVTCGTVVVSCPHTTAAITINENADPDVVHDVLLTLDELIPQHGRGYRHSEGNSDSHVKSSLVGCSETIIVEGGRMALGTWQGIYFCEFDGPRSRKVRVHCSGEQQSADKQTR